MSFKTDKQNFLSKKDKSKAGQIDAGVAQLCALINSLPDYFTTSSCAGRIVLIKLGSRKDKSHWLYKSHGLVDADRLWDTLRRDIRGSVWLKFEPFIMHIRCRDLRAAVKLLKLARNTGMKKAGIISASRNYVVELEGNDRLETIVYDNRLLVTRQYLAELTKQLNNKRKDNEKKLKRFITSLPRGLL